MQFTGVDFRYWRVAMGYTQAEAADILGVSRRAVQAWERPPARRERLRRMTALACRALMDHPGLADPSRPALS